MASDVEIGDVVVEMQHNATVVYSKVTDIAPTFDIGDNNVLLQYRSVQ